MILKHLLNFQDWDKNIIDRTTDDNEIFHCSKILKNSGIILISPLITSKRLVYVTAYLIEDSWNIFWFIYQKFNCYLSIK